MDRFARAFVFASLAWLTAGVSLGLGMIWAPGLRAHTLFPHVHANLLGWVSMLIYGVGYHVLPRFAGNPVWSPRLAWTHFGLTNVGLVGMVGFGIVVSYVGYSPEGRSWQQALAVSGTLEAAGIFCFVTNIAVSMRAHAPRTRPAWAPRTTNLPTGTPA